VRYLVVPDQEDAYETLVEHLVTVASDDPDARFDLLVPLGHRSHHPVALADARRHAHTHLCDLQRLLGDQGIAADGQVADDRLGWSIDQTIDRGDYDAIIIATPPTGTRGRLTLDFVHHLQRDYDLPVTHIVTPDAVWPQPPP
jgi:hypothetical protein